MTTFHSSESMSCSSQSANGASGDRTVKTTSTATANLEELLSGASEEVTGNGYDLPSTSTSISRDPQVECALEAAVAYRRRGWYCTPVPTQSKEVFEKGWNERLFGEEELAEVFRSRGAGNVGILHGPRSGGLVDIDCDTAETRQAGKCLLPETYMRHGRRSAGITHYWYRCPDIAAVQVFEDPNPAEGEKKKILEIRSNHMTLVPPSIHPTDGKLEWHDKRLDPAEVSRERLEKAAGQVAAVGVLARRWRRSEGSRHYLALAFGGMCARAGVAQDTAERLMQVVCLAAEDRESSNRLAAVRDSYRNHATGTPVTATGELRSLLGDETVRVLRQWLQLPAEPSVPTPAAGVSTDDWLPMPVDRMLTQDPPPAEWIFDNQMHRGVVAAVLGEGGAGKTFYTLELALSLATGEKLFDLYAPVQPMRVMAFFGEDSEAIIWERMRAIYNHVGFIEQEVALAGQNLYVVAGRAEPLVEVDAQGGARNDGPLREAGGRNNAVQA